jgi:hypothetical protein
MTTNDVDAYLTAEARRAALPLSDLGVERLLAETEALRRDAHARGRTAQAEALTTQVIALGDIRAERRQLREAVEDAVSPTRDLGLLDGD